MELSRLWFLRGGLHFSTDHNAYLIGQLCAFNTTGHLKCSAHTLLSTRSAPQMVATISLTIIILLFLHTIVMPEN